MKNVLIIAYYYPPLGGIGVLRPLHFSRYLLEYGWRASILTVANDQSYLRDESLSRKIPHGQPIARAYRVPVFEALRRLAKKNLRKYPLAYSFLDPQFDWVPSALRLGRRLMRSHDFDVILATAPPFSSLRVARGLKRDFNTPIIADLRDPFITDVVNWPSRLHKAFYEAYWRKLIGDHNRVVVVNEPMRRHIMDDSRLLHLDPVVIPNGYDPHDFAGKSNGPPDDRFVIGYVGSLYGKITPEPFFKSLVAAMKERPDMNTRLEVVFVGKIDTYQISLLMKKYSLNHVVHIRGFVPHSEAVQFMRGCHVLLLFTGMVYPSASGKIYEYAASQRPVLSFGVHEYTQKFITENGFGYSVDGRRPREGTTVLVELYDLFRKGASILGPSRENYEKYSRKKLTRNLARVLDSVI